MLITRLWLSLISGILLVGASFAPVEDSLNPVATIPAVLQSEAKDLGMSYMPLVPGRSLTYETREGERFTLSFEPPLAVTWFDGTTREVVPMRDSRCGCDTLLQNVNGEIRAVGGISHGRMEQWGEYVQVLPSLHAGPEGSLETPAGIFEDVLQIHTEQGSVWFAPNVGIIKTDEFELIEIGWQINKAWLPPIIQL